MSLIILFEPELVTINSIPYSLCPCFDCRGALSLGTSRRQRPRSPRPRFTTQSRYYRFTFRHCIQTDGASDGEDYQEGSHDMSEQNLQIRSQQAKPKVRFMSPPLLKSASRLSLPEGQFSFVDPFSQARLRLLQRQDSDCSDHSSLCGSPAFASHRDTFARLHRVPKDDLGSDDEESAYSTASSAIFPRPGLHRYRDTLARLHFLRNQAVALPANTLVTIGSYLNDIDYKSFRLTCRQWTDELPRPRSGAANRLPNEIILQILALLPPIDYDAARHVCKTWFSAGLDYKLSANMLKNSGNQPAYVLDLELERQKVVQQMSDVYSAESSDEDEHVQIGHEWLMSKRLATEARLSAAWRGSGLRPNTGHTLSNFGVVSVFDFRRLLLSDEQQQTSDDIKVQTCTVSACGVYLLLIVDCEILVYSLCEPGCPFAPVARIVACRRVLAVSMDTSSGRYAVAALLEGRLGCSWDLKSVLKSSSTICQVGEPLDLGLRTDVQGWTQFGVSKPVSMQPLPAETTQFSAPVTPHSFLGEEEDETIESLHGIVPYRTESPDTMSDWLDHGYESNDDLQRLLASIKSSYGTIDIITRPTGLYSNLGTSSDGPRSVAICPQRKCVAFGCRTGIELHWIDHATASRLNR